MFHDYSETVSQIIVNHTKDFSLRCKVGTVFYVPPDPKVTH